VLVDADPARIMSCLNVPEAKLKKRGIDSAEQRVTTLKALLGGKAPDIEAVHEAVLIGLTEKLGILAQKGVPSEEEEKLAAELCAEDIGTDAFVFSIDDPHGADVLEASRTGPGGTVTAYLRLEGAGEARRVRELLFTGDFFITPPRLIYDLEASLRGVMVGEAGAAVDRFFAAAKPGLLTIAPGDFRTVVEAAISCDRG
jgi:lipoate-protein ligase A